MSVKGPDLDCLIRHIDAANLSTPMGRGAEKNNYSSAMLWLCQAQFVCCLESADSTSSVLRFSRTAWNPDGQHLSVRSISSLPLVSACNVRSTEFRKPSERWTDRLSCRDQMPQGDECMDVSARTSPDWPSPPLLAGFSILPFKQCRHLLPSRSWNSGPTCALRPTARSICWSFTHYGLV